MDVLQGQPGGRLGSGERAVVVRDGRRDGVLLAELGWSAGGLAGHGPRLTVGQVRSHLALAVPPGRVKAGLIS
jgi:hypothetical protein